MATYYVATTGSDTTGDGSAGNPWATPGKGVATMAGGDTLYVKGGGYTLGGTLTPPAGTAASPTLVIGYSASPGDLDGDATMGGGASVWPVLTVPAATFGITISNAHVRVRNLVIDCANNSGTRGYYVSTGGLYPHLKNTKVMRFAQYGILMRGPGRAVGCWAAGGVSGATAAFYTDDASTFLACRASANACPGFYQSGAGTQFVRCLSHGNTGATSDGFISTGTSGGVYLDCVAYGNGRDGIRLDGASDGNSAVAFGNGLALNAGCGLRSATTTLSAAQADCNGFYSNTSGPRSGVPAGAHDITLTADPFTNAAAGDFSPNAAAGGGAALRAAGYPGVFPGGTTTGYPDVGAAQHQDAGGSVTYIFGSEG